eukprot:905931-Prorocentrum_minimum.AAC.9
MLAQTVANAGFRETALCTGVDCSTFTRNERCEECGEMFGECTLLLTRTTSGVYRGPVFTARMRSSLTAASSLRIARR